MTVLELPLPPHNVIYLDVERERRVLRQRRAQVFRPLHPSMLDPDPPKGAA